MAYYRPFFIDYKTENATEDKRSFEERYDLEELGEDVDWRSKRDQRRKVVVDSELDKFINNFFKYLNRAQDALAIAVAFYANQLGTRKVRGWLYFLTTISLLYSLTSYYFDFATIRGVEEIRKNIKNRTSVNILLEGIIFNNAVDFSLNLDTLNNNDQVDIDEFAKLMLPHPDAGIIQRVSNGILPIIGEDGRKAWQVYNRPYNSIDQRNKVAIIITDVGINQTTSGQALKLPGEVTIAFSVYARQLSKWVQAARDLGHEVLLTLPMQPLNFPEDDAGPLTILNNQSDWQVVKRLVTIMSRATGYVGFINSYGGATLGSRVTTSQVLNEITNRGLMFVEQPRDALSFANDVSLLLKTPYVPVDKHVDKPLTDDEISTLLLTIERKARETGHATISLRNYRLVTEFIERWIDSLKKRNYVIVPVSAIAQTLIQKQIFNE